MCPGSPATCKVAQPSLQLKKSLAEFPSASNFVCVCKISLTKEMKGWCRGVVFLPAWIIRLVGFFPGLGGISIFLCLLHSSSNASTAETNISEKQIGLRSYRLKFPCAFALHCRDTVTPACLHMAEAFKYTGDCLLQLFCKVSWEYACNLKTRPVTCTEGQRFRCFGSPR